MTDQPMRDLTKSEYRALYDAIKADGVQIPIATRADGTIIDGHNRKRITEELGIDCPTMIIDVSDDTARRLAEVLNAARRQLTRQEMKEHMRHLADEGLTDHAIADLTGVPRRTVSRTLSPSVGPIGPTERELGKIRKPTATERDRIRAFCLEQWRKGYRTETIRDALGFGSISTIRTYLGSEASGSRRYKEPAEPLQPYDWRDSRRLPPRNMPSRSHHKDVDTNLRIDPPTPYKVSTTLQLLTAILQELRNDNAENRFANDVGDALAAADQDWLIRAQQIVGDVHAYLRRLDGVLVDKGQRERAIYDMTQRDDMAAVLRLVQPTG
jgi:hypothetical protein